ncbi:MAG: hypothetical protein ACRDLP_17550 [Solirubrobacteraceae bacterium]
MKRLLAAAMVAGALVAPAMALGESGLTASTLRSAAARLLTAELARDGATACGILNAPLTATVHGRTCAQRWDARIGHMLARRGGRAALRADLRAVPSAAVSISGEWGTIALPHPLLDGQSRFYWTANCWMLNG